MPGWLRNPRPGIAWLGVVILVLLGEWFGRMLWNFSLWALVTQNPYGSLSMLFGVVTGAAEVVARYRDEPFAATFSVPGACYLALNGIISGSAYAILTKYKDKVLPGMTDDLLRSIVAGFGAMVIMRSKLFNFKTEGGEEYAIGPDAVLSTFLSSVDRKIDRYRSLRRQQIVYQKAAGVTNPVAAPAFLRTSLASYQNLGAAEKRDLDTAIQQIVADSNLEPRLKLMAICFGLLNVCGERNFSDLMELLQKYQQSP